MRLRTTCVIAVCLVMMAISATAAPSVEKSGPIRLFTDEEDRGTEEPVPVPVPPPFLLAI